MEETVQLYNVYTDTGCVRSNVSLLDAADEILSHDSAQWEIRETSPGIYQIWTRKECANKPWTSTLLIRAADNEDEARELLSADVVARSGEWRGAPYAVRIEDDIAEDDA